MPTLWSEDIWQSVTQALPNIKNAKRIRLTLESLVLVMQTAELDVADDPEGNYPTSSLQAHVRRWQHDGTLHSILSVFENCGLSKDWPSAPTNFQFARNYVGLRDLIIKALLEVRGVPISEEYSALAAWKEEDWLNLFDVVPELIDSERSRYVLSNIDTFMRDPDSRWSDLEKSDRYRIKLAISQWERRGLLASVIRKLTDNDLTLSWVDGTMSLDSRTERTSIRGLIVGHLKKARRRVAARQLREQQATLKKPLNWKKRPKAARAKSTKTAKAKKDTVARAVNNLHRPGSSNEFAVAQLTAEELEMWRAKRKLKKLKVIGSHPISRREKERRRF